MLSDDGVRQRGGDASEANGGDGVAGRPAVDEGAAVSGPRDAGGEAVKMKIVPLRGPGVSRAPSPHSPL
jgi:hypothetical protein